MPKRKGLKSMWKGGHKAKEYQLPSKSASDNEANKDND